jgi:hypothetical protein
MAHMIEMTKAGLFLKHDESCEDIMNCPYTRAFCRIPASDDGIGVGLSTDGRLFICEGEIEEA